MSDIFEFLIEFFLAEVRGVLLIWALVGAIIVLVGIAAWVICAIHMIVGTKAELKLVALHPKLRKIDDDDDAEEIAHKKANPRLVEEYEVLTGKNVGTRVKSTSASTKPLHAVGDIVTGYYNLKHGGDAMSVKGLRRGFTLGFWFILGGLAFIKFISVMAS
ncbi:hypothetical protein ACJ3XI_02500 [Litorimonas sp. RW-G-Af-16]|uniref:hypothetical protein n=1 Tax=Litorimonas sp. RW-G-Af-16 TaxID=3241168 RepID=UPI00390CC43A